MATAITKKDQVKATIMEFLNKQVGSVSRKDINDKIHDLGSVRTISRALAELKIEGLVLQQKDGKTFSWVSTEPKTKKKAGKTAEEKAEQIASDADKKETRKTKSDKGTKVLATDKPKKLHDLSKMKTEFVDGLVDQILTKDKKKPTKANIAKVRTMLETTDFIDKLKKVAKKKKLTKENLVKAGKTKSTKATKSAKKDDKKKNKKPGVIATIIKAITTKRRTKKQILKVLVKAFPEREADKMMKTINVQVPSRLRKDKELNIEKTDKGYKIK